MEISETDLSQKPPEAEPEKPAKPSVNIWVEQGPNMQKVIARGDTTVIFSHALGDAPDKWRMLAMPRDAVSDRTTFMALYKSMTEYAQAKDWIAPPGPSRGIQRRSVTIPLDRLPQLQSVIKNGNMADIQALGVKNAGPTADSQK